MTVSFYILSNCSLSLSHSHSHSLSLALALALALALTLSLMVSLSPQTLKLVRTAEYAPLVIFIAPTDTSAQVLFTIIH